MKFYFLILISSLACLLSIDAIGQDPIVRSELCSDTILVGQQFTLTYIVEGAQISDLDAPDLEEFNFLAGPNTSSSMSFINGKMSAKSSINYVLQGAQPGDYTIAPATIKIGEEEYKTESHKIVILENPGYEFPQDPLRQNPVKKKSKRKTTKI